MSKKSAFRFIILLGLVSLFADITYEGARSITGPYLSILGASGAAVGLIVGFGEFIGFGLRALFGYISDKTKAYWPLTLIGYAINLLSVPLLAIANSWQWAAMFILFERFGKAIRTPARDTMLSYATHETGRGKGFGIHEAMDQIGAVLGPLLVGALFLLEGKYQQGFAFLLIPSLFALGILLRARVLYPVPQNMEPVTHSLTTEGLSKRYWLYLLGIGLVAAGYADFALIAFHFQKSIDPDWIPFLYAIAMSVDGIAALFWGRLFDRKGMAILAVSTLLSALFAPLVFLGGFYSALIGMVLWGIGMGAQESIMRAVIPSLVPIHKRGSAYGMMNLVFGLFWAVGSGIMGFFYDTSMLALVAFSVLTQLVAIPVFLSLRLGEKVR